MANYKNNEDGKWLIQDDGVELLIEPSQGFIDRHKPTKEKQIKDINNNVRRKIAEQYDIHKELEMLNQALINPADTDYLEYKQYRQDCLNWGVLEKNKLEG